MFTKLICVAALAISCVCAKPGVAPVAYSAPLLAAAGPSVLTAQSAQIVGRNYNGIARLAYAAAPLAYSAPVAARLAASPLALAAAGYAAPAAAALAYTAPGIAAAGPLAYSAPALAAYSPLAYNAAALRAPLAAYSPYLL
ncbi:cuticle protein 16.5-like [Toxorhynchites rutilus septentrionalis]|uniref:cuticle protein 16.5-like n=1 Tax=Toxorhynchites rutilus septentrionalis TaxID=329112 RepID=UPI0024795B78|nr:cuticle protein 16.5-like [Toxorhynchites rutilus septentrionalis]